MCSYKLKRVDGVGESRKIYTYDFIGLNRDYYNFLFSCKDIVIEKAVLDYVPCMNYTDGVNAKIVKTEEDFRDIEKFSYIVFSSFFITYRGIKMDVNLSPCFNELGIFATESNLSNSEIEYLFGSFMTDLHTYLSLHSDLD